MHVRGIYLLSKSLHEKGDCLFNDFTLLDLKVWWDFYLKESKIYSKTYSGQSHIKQCFSFNVINCTSFSINLEKAMATHSSTLAWKIPWTEEPGRLQSMGSRRVRHDWATPLLLFTFMHWRRKWQPTPVFLPGESQGRQSLVCCCLWGRTELDMTEVT